jgi:hypothetical protein
MIGVALGIELAVRGPGAQLGAVAAIDSIVVLLVAMFFGGWSTSRLAVGESKLEAVLYGQILWGVLFMGMFWVMASGMRSGSGALSGAASGVYASDEGRVDDDWVARDLKRAGVDDATVDKYRGYYERIRNNPAGVRAGRDHRRPHILRKPSHRDEPMIPGRRLDPTGRSGRHAVERLTEGGLNDGTIRPAIDPARGLAALLACAHAVRRPAASLGPARGGRRPGPGPGAAESRGPGHRGGDPRHPASADDPRGAAAAGPVA